MASVSVSQLRHSICRAAFFLSVALIGTALLACQPPPKEDTEAMAEKQEEASVQTRTEPLEDSELTDEEQKTVVAKVNDEKFTLGEFERRLNSQAPFARARYNTQERKKDFLENMVQFEALADEAERLGYDKDPQVVLNLKQAMVRKMMADQISQKVNIDDISDEELKEYYEAHKDDYVRPAKVRVSQIVAEDKASAEKILDELKREFKKDPTHKRRIFALKARDVSIDKTTAKLGGDMRFFSHPDDGGTVSKKLADKAFALEHVGDMTEPFQTDKGWHILMLTAKKQRYEKTFEDVKRNIANRLYREKRARAEREYVEDLKKKADIEIHEDVLQKISEATDSSGAEQPGPGKKPSWPGAGSGTEGAPEQK